MKTTDLALYALASEKHPITLVCEDQKRETMIPVAAKALNLLRAGASEIIIVVLGVNSSSTDYAEALNNITNKLNNCRSLLVNRTEELEITTYPSSENFVVYVNFKEKIKKIPKEI